MRTPMTLSSLLVLLLAATGTVWAQDTTAPVQTQAREQIYGSQLMTPQERREHSARLRAAKTEQEREQIRQEHHKQMQERAKERGVTLPDEPTPGGKGKGAATAPGGGKAGKCGSGKCGGVGPGGGSGGGPGGGGGGGGR